MKPVKILLVDDDEDDYILTRDLLKEIPERVFTIDWEYTFDKALEAIKQKMYDVYLVDYRLGRNTGVELLHEALNAGCTEPIIMITGKGNPAVDVEAMKSGASDYLVKDKLDSFVLERSIRYAIERSQAIQAIRESEVKYRNIFEKSKDVIYITNKAGDFLDLNASATQVFGYTREEFLKLNARDLYANPMDRLLFEEIIQKKGEVTDFEVTLLTKNKDKIYCLLTTVIQPRDGGEELYQGIIHDITKRKKAEQELMNIEKLAVTGRIARTIAHEVRNPITNVNLALEQLRQEMLPADESLNLFFDIISRNTERINQLITELLNSAKPNILTFKKYSIHELLDASLVLAQDRMTLKGIKVIKEYTKDECDVSVDAETLKIAFVNIIINAVEAMEPGKGRLRIITERQDDACIVRIIDNGMGIDAENIARLFEPFYSSKSKGMGLGLTTAHNIIVSHKATIEAESELGKGTIFNLRFPLTQDL